MSPADAAKLLDLPADASPEQLEARFHELRTKLEEKIGKAPTPGLKAKYRESLDEITLAFETLTLAADSSSLPVTSKQSAVSSQRSVNTAATPGSPLPVPGSSARKSGGKEFILVAAIAVAVLAAGGWYVMKTRAESAEQARIAAEQKAEADRQAEAARLAAEAKKKTEEEQKLRVAAAAKAEQERLEKLGAQVRVQLAEAKLAWEQVERIERDAERQLADLKSEERSARDLNEGRRNELAARSEQQTAYHRWLTDFLARHPARLAQVRASELLSARQVDDAAKESVGLAGVITSARSEISSQQAKLDADLHGTLVLELENPDDNWVVTDAFGRRREGKGSARLENLARGTGTVALSRAGWLSQTGSFTVIAGAVKNHLARLHAAEITITASVPGAMVYEGGRELGAAPLTLRARPPGEASFEIVAPDHRKAKVSGLGQPGKSLTLSAELVRLTDQDVLLELIRPFAGHWVARGVNLIKTRDEYLTFPAGSLKGNIRVTKPEQVGESTFVLLDRATGLVGVNIWGLMITPIRRNGDRLEVAGYYYIRENGRIVAAKGQKLENINSTIRTYTPSN